MTQNLFASDRQDPPHSGSERAILEGFLDFHRDTLLRKCEGLTDEQLKTRSCEPSTLTLLGLLRHLAEVEAWFNDDLADGQIPGIYWSEQDPDGDFDNLADAVVADDLATYRGTVERSRAFAAGITDLDTVLSRSRSGADISLRWIYVHMIEEYARHNGHADLLRERIDGATGE
ncbi:DinB family protein [Ornithinimicrobium sp. F0845]|uniref:DinB family protein n=1 Tax=Ornithinimicrobium sp. F0845 TaxID=2926412 RepID=UPI001FF52130|nr:DinB family protein [Ornithinimicrobium sp. F0845]MCK0110581.1 DinB family protein [Ornithinimicrobium sp. F0845]